MGYQYVIDEVDQPYGSNVSLSTTFPSRQLDQEPSDKSLRDAGLVPSTTILVLPKSRSSSSLTPANGGIMDYVWLLLTPLTVVWGLISSFIFGQGQPPSVGNQGRKRQANEASTSGARATKKKSGIKTDGNIARLSNNDDDDENSTKNQQQQQHKHNNNYHGKIPHNKNNNKKNTIYKTATPN